MTSRRLIRVKVLHILYSYTKKENVTLPEAERDLLKSIDKSTDLYFLLFLLLTEIKHKAFLKIDVAKNKHFATEEELNPNTRFIDNPVFTAIENNRKFKTVVRNNLLSWTDYPEIIETLYKEIIRSEAYATYMHLPEADFEAHKKVILRLFAEHIATNETFLQVLEDKSIFWNDDISLVFELVYKTLRNIPDAPHAEDDIFMQVYKNDEDADFAKILLHRSILEFDTNIEIINGLIQNWEIDRLAEVDKLIMVIALSELKNFSFIPVKVTLDEYIEISKAYNSPKSGSFVNGILDNAIIALKEKGEIKKIGRGLME